MTKPEALPFDLERWVELSKQGYRLGVGDKTERRFVGLLSDGCVVFEREGFPYQVQQRDCWMLPPIPVIEFKVGLFCNRDDANQYWVSCNAESKRDFVRLLTPDELATGKVRME